MVGFAPAIGPTLSGVLVDTVGWRMLFVLVSVLMVIVTFCALKWLRIDNDFDPATFDPVSVVLSSLGLVALLYGLSSVTKSEVIAVPIALIAVGVMLLALFVVRQLKLKTPLLRIDVLKVGRYRASVIAVMLDASVTTGMSVLLPLFIQNLLGYSAFMTGIVMLPGALAGAVVGLLAGRLFDRYGIRVCAVPGATFMALALIGMVAFLMNGVALGVVALLYGVMFVGLQLVNTTVGTWGLNALDNRVIQHAQATSNTLNQVAASLLTAVVISITALGPSLVGNADAAAALEAGYHLGFCAVLAVVAINFAVIVLFVRDKKPAQADEAVKVVGEYPSTGEGVAVNPEEVAVELVMNRSPYAIAATAPIRELAALLVERRTGGVPVVDADDVVVGFVSDGDIMKYLAASERSLIDATLTLYRFSDPETFGERIGDLMAMKVEVIMTREVIAVEDSLSLEQACRILSGNHLRKVPVVNAEGRLVGSLSRSDIVRATLTDMMAKMTNGRTV